MIAAGTKRTFLASYGNCYCTRVGMTHTYTVQYLIEPGLGDTILGGLEVIAGVGTFVAGVGSSEIGVGIPLIAGGIAGIIDGCNRATPYIETTVTTYRCTSAANGHATSHCFVSSDTN